MPKISAAKATRTYNALSKFVARQDVVDALEKATKSPTLFRKAKADPKAFLQSEGVKVPARAQITIARQTGAPTGGRIYCLTICIVFGSSSSVFEFASLCSKPKAHEPYRLTTCWRSIAWPAARPNARGRRALQAHV